MTLLRSFVGSALQMMARLLAAPPRQPLRNQRRTRLSMDVLEDRAVPAVAYSTVNDWGSGLQGQVAITNDQGATLTDWRLEFDYGRPITQLWNATIVSQQGTHYVIQGLSWNNTVAVGQTVSFGFTAGAGSASDVPTHFVLTGAGTPAPVLPGVSIADISVTEGNPTATSPGAAAGFFHTSGNQIVDSNNNPVRLAGVNWFGFETGNYAPHGLWTRGYKDMMDQMKSTGFNVIRLPFSDQLFAVGSTPNGIDFSKNPDLQGLTGLQIMDKIVDYAGQIGLRIILDHHRSAAGDGPNSNGLWYEGAYPESTWIANWTMLAQRYAGNATVIGADLANEPHGPATWGDGSANDWRLAAERAGNAILAANPNWLIIVEGVETTASGNTWWGGNLSNAGTHPVRLNVAGRLVYSPHDYPASVYPQQWFSDPAYPANLPAVWDRTWGYLFREGTAPILLGEFGSRLATASDQQWAQKMVQYIQGDLNGDGTNDLGANQLGISWIWWSWNPNSRDTGGILNDDWTTVRANAVSLLQPVQFNLGGGSTGPSATAATFTVTLSQASTQPVSVQYATANGTATSGSDYTPLTGTLTFAPGETQKTITVSVLRDTTAESTEAFTLRLSSPTNATLTKTSATATILDDDTVTPPPPPPPPLPGLSIGDVSITEGHSGTKNATFTVTLSAAATNAVTVNYATANGTATAGSDYTAASGTLTFAAGERTKTITVAIRGDTAIEANETFRVLLTNPANAFLADGEAIGTITNDDIAAPSSAVTFTKRDDWGSGFVADMTIKNTGTTPMSNWTLEFDLAADITNIWGAEIVSRVGNRYVIRAASWNNTIPPGGSITFGFQGTPGLNTTLPTNIMLNGVLV